MGGTVLYTSTSMSSICGHVQQYSVRHTIFLGVLFAVTLLATTVGGNVRVSALSNIMPDPSEYGAAAPTVGLSLDNTPGSPGVSAVGVPVYARAPLPSGGINVRLTHLFINSGSQIRPCHNGVKLSDGDAFTLSPSDFNWDATNQLYRAFVQIRWCTTPVMNDQQSTTFRLEAPGDTVGGKLKYVIGYTPPSGKGVFSSDNISAINDDAHKIFANYGLQFATPCNVTSATNNTITLHDLDSGNPDNNNGTVTISIYDVTDGKTVSYTDNGAANMQTSGKDYELTMQFKPRHKYVLRINNVYWFNVLQYRMPYDNIAYLNGCPSGSISPTLALNPPGGSSITDGYPLAVNFGVINSSDSTAAKVCYNAQIWYEKTGNTSYDAGDIRYFQKASDECGGSNDFATIPADSADHSVASDIRSVDVSKGGRICAQWHIESRTATISAAEPNTLTQCVTIGKRPLFQVWGNDLRVGSALTTDASKTSRIVSQLSSKPSGVVNPPTLISPTTPIPTSGTCTPWDAGDLTAVYGAAGWLQKLKDAYGSVTLITTSRKNSPGLSQRYISSVATPSYVDANAIPHSHTDYNIDSCMETSGIAFLSDRFNHFQPAKAEQWRLLINQAFTNGDSASKLRTYTTSPKNQIASFANDYGKTPRPDNIFYPFFNQLIRDYDPAYAAKGSKDLTKDYFDYQLWAVSGSETPGQTEQKDNITNNNTAGASVFKQTFDTDYNKIAGAQTSNQEGTGMILFAMVADDFGAAYLNGHFLSSDVVGMPKGDVSSKAGRLVTVAVDPSWFKPPDASGMSKGNELTVIDFDKYLQDSQRDPGKVGVGVMYTMLYFAPKNPPLTYTYYSSWGEYSVLAPGTGGVSTVQAVASGSGLANGYTSSAQSAWSKLTFANTPLYGNYASPTNTGVIPNIKNYLMRADLNLGSAKRQIVKGDVTISNGAGSMSPASLTSAGGGIVISNGTVTIADNITYGGGSDENTMPQVVIVAPRINIQGNVTQVDAWLIAANETNTGTINTCSDVAPTAALSTTICDKPLHVNGAVTANTVWLRRTAGSTTANPKEPAETLNLRGDAYIWAHNLSVKNGRWTTRTVTELPPRY